jgi:signal transduction histidine kinase
VERRFDALYERAKPRYLHVVLIGVCVLACGVAVPLWAAIDARPPTRRIADPWMIGTETGLGVVVGIPVIWLVFLTRHRALVRWLAGRPEAAALAAWRSAVRMPGTLTIVLVLFWLCISLPVHIVAANRSGLHPMGLAVSAGSSAFVLLGVGVFFVMALEMAMAPAIRDIALHAPARQEVPRAWLDLRRRLIVVTGAIAIFTGASVGSLTVGEGHHREGELMHMFVATCVAGVTITAALTLMLRRSLLHRLDELRAALGAVRAGRLDRRVIPSNGDELDEVGAAFNDMVSRLAAYEADMQSARVRLVSAASDERRRIERDLHDGVQQYLALMQLQLTNIQRESDPARAVAMAEEARTTLTEASRELRSLAHGIYPVVLERSGLEQALTMAAGRSTIPADVTAAGIGRLDRDRENAVYYCCLEALQNANKYAGSLARATIALALDDSYLEFSVTDDGVGFELEASDGHGLTNMRDRIGAFGGEIAVSSAPGAGTRVHGRIPLAAVTAV